MKFAFVENRYKTIFWHAVAARLAGSGHDVAWGVQNPSFAPQGENVTVFPFPRSGQLSPCPDAPALDFIRRSDRNINYFGGDDRHYGHYQSAIDAWLDRASPDVVVGESTLFHELMVIDWCKRNNVPFLHPIMIGYPGKRFAIFAGDSKTPAACNDSVPDDRQCLEVANAIGRRERIPDYMRAPAANDPMRVHPAPKSLKDRLNILRGFVSGERFNTPSPWTKWKLDRQVRQRLDAWSSIANARAFGAADGRVVLYPLQMQPESNLDVWGQAHRDQAGLVRALADAMPEGWHLRVKANPKAKYELSDDLIDVLRNHPKTSPVPLNQAMGEVMSGADLVCTVTGTIAVECFLAGKPIAQLGPSVVEECACSVHIDGASEIPGVIRRVERNELRQPTDAERIALVQKLYATSFAGYVSDPSSLPGVLQSGNVCTVAETLERVARQCVAS